MKLRHSILKHIFFAVIISCTLAPGPQMRVTLDPNMLEELLTFPINDLEGVYQFSLALKHYENTRGPFGVKAMQVIEQRLIDIQNSGIASTVPGRGGSVGGVLDFDRYQGPHFQLTLEGRTGPGVGRTSTRLFDGNNPLHSFRVRDEVIYRASDLFPGRIQPPRLPGVPSVQQRLSADRLDDAMRALNRPDTGVRVRIGRGYSGRPDWSPASTAYGFAAGSFHAELMPLLIPDPLERRVAEAAALEAIPGVGPGAAALYSDVNHVFDGLQRNAPAIRKEWEAGGGGVEGWFWRNAVKPIGSFFCD